MRWATRSGVHVDRAACAWLIRHAIDPDAVFVYVDAVEDVPAGVTPFDMPGVELGHHGADCSFETFLRRYELHDPVLAALGELIHEADIEDDRFDAPAARGLDVIVRGLSITLDDDAVITAATPVFDGLYEYLRRGLLLGRDPA